MSFEVCSPLPEAAVFEFSEPLEKSGGFPEDFPAFPSFEENNFFSGFGMTLEIAYIPIFDRHSLSQNWSSKTALQTSGVDSDGDSEIQDRCITVS